MSTPKLVLAAISTIFALATLHAAGEAEEPTPPPCNEDAMIVFDASGSMAGNVDQGIATIKPRIDEARHALSSVLPHNPLSSRRSHHLRPRGIQSM